MELLNDIDAVYVAIKGLVISLFWIVTILGSLAGFAAVLCHVIAWVDKEITGRRNQT